MSHYDNTDRVAYMVLGGLLGVGMGTVVGMLVAPRKGEESREQLRLKAQELQIKGKRQLEERKEQARSAVRNAADKTSEAADKAADKAKDTARDVRERSDRV